jgi:hypothetical protein
MAGARNGVVRQDNPWTTELIVVFVLLQQVIAGEDEARRAGPATLSRLSRVSAASGHADKVHLGAYPEGGWERDVTCNVDGSWHSSAPMRVGVPSYTANFTSVFYKGLK